MKFWNFLRVFACFRPPVRWVAAGVLAFGLAAGAGRGMAEPVGSESVVPVVKLADAEGTVREPLAEAGQKATLIFFLTTECPIGNVYAPEIRRIAEEYGKRGVVSWGIYSYETREEIAGHLKEYGLPLPGLLDAKGVLAHFTGATVTPEACVLSPAGVVLYRGRIDDRAVKFGTVRTEPQVRDLRLALDAVLAGKSVVEKFTKAIGCFISPAEEGSE